MKIGAKNRLVIQRFTPPGAFLADSEGNEVLLPTKFIPEDVEVDQEIEVFIYKDSEDRIIATTLEPYIQIDEFGFLKAKEVTRFGAFLDWGIEKDLLVPFREQIGKMVQGESYLIYLYLDPKTERLVGTQKIQSFFEKMDIRLEEGEEVDLLIGNETELGMNVIINNTYQGLVFENEIFDDIMIGDRMKGYIKKIREDNKIDVSLRKTGLENLESGAEKIIRHLEQNEGFLELTDKSTPEDIQFHLQMSKKNFKRSVGILYKKRLIELTEGGIRKL
ncbi:MAG: S1-like domain-containing RNA-binding protein [Cyclobacteriaceae bacterium]